MIFYIHKNVGGTNKHYTFSLLERLAKLNRHDVTPDPARAEMILVSLCDVTGLADLEKIRHYHPDQRIAVGGHFAFYYKACAIFADIVNVGQGFEFFKCKNESEMRNLDCVYYRGKPGTLTPSTLIEWEKCHVVQVNTRTFYYWGGTGCKNKCRFCFTSWTNKHQKNNEMRIKRATASVKGKGFLTVISNEYGEDYRYTPVKDMMLKDFIKLKSCKTRLVRMGLEFATPENRKKYGKPFPDEDFYKAIVLAERFGVEVQFFCIGGMDPRRDWYNLFSEIPWGDNVRPRVFIKFTNLEYQMFTPLFKCRHDIKTENYLDKKFIDKMFQISVYRNKRVRFFQCKYPAHALWRIGTSLCIDRDQYDSMKALSKEKDIEIVHKALYSTKVIETDYQDEVKFWYKKGS